MEKHTYRVSGWNPSTKQHETKCLVNAESMAHAIMTAYHSGWLKRFQVNTAKAEVTSTKETAQ
jgi:hypothetical protein